MKTRAMIRLFATVLVPIGAVANACGDDDNTVLTGTDGGRSGDATVDATGDGPKGSDGSTSDSGDAEADSPFVPPEPCQWALRDGGTHTESDGAVFDEPDTGIAPVADAASDGGVLYPEAYCRAACDQTLGYPGVCRPAPSGQLWCLYCLGRRPEGFTELATDSDDPARSFAAMARLEAASVVAFRTLARELAFHRAPKRLVRAAERAARDEIRHARAMTALARRHGATVGIDDIATPPIRDLETIARENAVEGCVHETWGALFAHDQARAERDPVVRAVMKRIARDETEHAALGWQIAGWANGRLDRAARERVARARREASERLLASAEGENRRLLARLDADLWSRAA